MYRIAWAIAFIFAATAAHAQGAAFDGTYRGEAPGGSCSVYTPVLRVRDGTATLRFNQEITFEGKVAGDGGLNLQYGAATVSGKFSGKTFQGDLAYRRCHYVLTLTK